MGVEFINDYSSCSRRGTGAGEGTAEWVWRNLLNEEINERTKFKKDPRKVRSSP